MPTVTVQAPDSALAMDEVIRQLGDNAYIVSTNTRDGQVEILATTEPAQIIALRKREPKASFAEVIMEQVNLGTSNPANISPIVSLALGAADVSRFPSLASITADISPKVAEPEEGPVATDQGADPETEEAEVISETLPPDATQDTAPHAASDTAPYPEHGPESQEEPELRAILRQLASQLARIERTAADGPTPPPKAQDPIEAAGFSAKIIGRLLSGKAQDDRATAFASAMANALVVADPSAHLRAPAVVIVGPSGSGKTVLAAKIAALTLETQSDRTVELVSLSGPQPLVNPALSAHARTLSCNHRSLRPDQLDAVQMSRHGVTQIFDTNLDAEDLAKSLAAIGDQVGRTDVVLIVALPAGSSLTRIRAELEKYSGLDPVIALTKLDECELSPQEASQIAEIGTRIAWLSGTSSLTDTMAPATEETIFEFLTGLLTVGP